GVAQRGQPGADVVVQVVGVEVLSQVVGIVDGPPGDLRGQVDARPRDLERVLQRPVRGGAGTDQAEERAGGDAEPLGPAGEDAGLVDEGLTDVEDHRAHHGPERSVRSCRVACSPGCGGSVFRRRPDPRIKVSGMTHPAIPVTLSTASVYPRRAAFAFESAAEIGFDGVAVMVWSDPATQDPKALSKLAADTGMPIRSIHAPTLLVSQRVWGRSPADKLARAVDMAGELGARTVVVHPPFRWQYRYARSFEEQVRELNAGGPVTVAVENMYPWRPHSRLDRELKAYLPGWDPMEHGYDAVTLDLSHAAVAQQDGLDLLREFGDRLRHVHLADGTFNARDEHLVPGRGDMHCDKVLTE